MALKKEMRVALFCFLVIAAGTVMAAQWRPVPSPAEYQAMVDLDSVKPQKNLASFTLRRVYREAGA